MILDIGCGYNPRGDINIDIDRKFFYGKYVYVQCSVTNLPFKNEIFEKIISIEVLEHLNESYKSILEIKRVMKYKGKFLFTTPNPYLWRRILRRILNINFNVTKNHIKLFSKEELENLFNKIGFSNIDIKFTNLKEYYYHKFWKYLDSLFPHNLRRNIIGVIEK